MFSELFTRCSITHFYDFSHSFVFYNNATLFELLGFVVNQDIPFSDNLESDVEILSIDDEISEQRVDEEDEISEQIVDENGQEIKNDASGNEPVCQIDAFLGENPTTQKAIDLNIIDDLIDRVKVWTASGLPDKEDKLKILNDELAIDLHPKALARDDYFVKYQNFTGSVLSLNLSVLNSMLTNNLFASNEMRPLIEQQSNAVKLLCELYFILNKARRSFVIAKYDVKMQKTLKKIESTKGLFGENLRSAVENIKAMEKVAKGMRGKPDNFKSTFKQAHPFLNWKSSTVRREVGRESSRTHPRFNTSKRNSYSNSQKNRPPKRSYGQSQPQRQTRR